MVRWQCVVPLSIFVHAQKLDVLLLWQELGRRVGEVLGTQQSTERSRGQVDRGTVRSKMRHICLSMPPDPVRLINSGCYCNCNCKDRPQAATRRQAIPLV